MTKTILDSLIAVGNIHASRLQKAYQHLLPILPIQAQHLDNLSDINLGFLELLTSRFAKLQDLIGAKLFPLILKLLQEDQPNQTALDGLHRLEKIGLLPSVSAWIQMRELRNQMTHEYPDNDKLIAENLNKVAEASQVLLAYWSSLLSKIANVPD